MLVAIFHDECRVVGWIHFAPRHANNVMDVMCIFNQNMKWSRYPPIFENNNKSTVQWQSLQIGSLDIPDDAKCQARRLSKNSKNYRSDANQKPSFLQYVQLLHTEHTNTLTY